MFDSEYETYNIKPFYLVINLLFGHIEKTEGSSARYLVVNINNINNKKIINVFDEIWKYIEQRITADGIWKFVEEKFRCVIEKDGKYYPEIYLDEGLYVKNY